VSFDWFLQNPGIVDAMIGRVVLDGVVWHNLTIADMSQYLPGGVAQGHYTALLSLAGGPGRLTFDLFGFGGSPVAGVDNVSVTPVPEPTTLLLLGSGLLGLGGVAWRRSRKS